MRIFYNDDGVVVGSISGTKEIESNFNISDTQSMEVPEDFMKLFLTTDLEPTYCKVVDGKLVAGDPPSKTGITILDNP